MVLSDVNRINKIVLLVGENKRRINSFKQAVLEEGLDFLYYSWNDFDKFINAYNYKEDLTSVALKIDSPTWDSFEVSELNKLVGGYIEKLKMIDSMNFNNFLNKPEDIATLLNKRKCKEILCKNDIAVTKMYDVKFNNSKALIDYLIENRIPRAFIKPLYGSGAAGVTAINVNLALKKVVIYTCCKICNGKLYNTKKIHRYEGKLALDILDSILELDCILEKWYAKAKYNEYSYDLRVVVQDGKVNYIQPRLSKGPITNLHLNNCSIDFTNLGLSDKVVNDIENLCKRAYNVFDGLNSVGIDILLERNTYKPYIIEMNAQGDLMHNDVKNKNTIYKNQVKIIKKL